MENDVVSIVPIRSTPSIARVLPVIVVLVVLLPRGPLVLQGVHVEHDLERFLRRLMLRLGAAVAVVVDW